MSADKFLQDHGRLLETFEFCHGIDNNQNVRSEFHGAEKRILMVFLSTGPTRSVSNTYTVLNNLIKSRYGSLIFVDNCYLPAKGDIKIYKKNNQRFMFGNVSHKSWEDYDLILISMSILTELYNLPFVLKYNGIPWEFNLRMQNNKLPLVLGGGVCSPMADILYGNVSSEGGCLLDGVFVGHAEGGFLDLLDSVRERDLKKNKKDILMGFAQQSPYFYIPALYDVKHRYSSDYGYIIDDVLSQAGLPDIVNFAHIPKSMDFPGFERKVLNVSGDSVTSADLAISTGCSGGGSCSFKVSKGTMINTSGGPKRIEDCINDSEFRVDALEEDVCERVWKQPSSVGLKVILDRGNSLLCDDEHKWMVLDPDSMSLAEKKTHELKVGDPVLIRRGVLAFGPQLSLDNLGPLDEELALLMGFIHGDGHITRDSRRLLVHLTVDEAAVLHPILEKRIGRSDLREFRESKDGRMSYEYRSSLIQVEDLNTLNCDLRSQELRVPFEIFKSPRLVISAYLRGLFQADGWVNHTIGLTSVSRGFLEDVQKLLWMLKVDSRIRTRDINKYCRDGYKRSDSSYLLVRGTLSFNLFLCEVGFICKKGELKRLDSDGGTKADVPVSLLREVIRSSHSRSDLPGGSRGIYDLSVGNLTYYCLEKLSQFTVIPEVYHLIGKGEFFVGRVKQVIDTGKVVDMYDLTTRNTHLCVFDSILTHQCYEGTVAGPFRDINLDLVKKNMRALRLNAAPNTVSWYCVAGNTEVEVNGTIANIESFQGVSQGIIRTNEGLSRFDSIVSSGDKEVFCVTTERGYSISCTKDHPLFVPFGDGVVKRQLQDLSEGDSVTLFGEKTCFDSPLKANDFYLAGLWHGDGSELSSSTIDIFFGKNDLDVYNQIVVLEGVVSYGSRKHDNYARLGNHKTQNILRIVGSQVDKISSVVKNAIDVDKISFFRGLFDATGNIHNGKIYFTSVRRGFVSDLQNLLLSMGIFSRLMRVERAGFPDETRYTYRLYISGKRSNIEFVRVVNSLNTITREKLNHVSQVAVWADKFGSTVHYNLFFDKIAMINRIGLLPTYDVINSSSGSFIANGFQVSNSYNLNYYYRFIDLIYEAACKFSQLSLINMRADVIGAKPEYLEISRMLGLRRCSLAVEGIGERIRNGFLNKNLTFEQWQNAARAVFKTRLAECLCEGELYLTDAGLIPCEDLTVRHKVWDGYRFMRVFKIFSNPPEPCVEVSLSNGLFIRCKETHEFVNNDGLEICARDLELGVQLKLINERPNLVPSIPTFCIPETLNAPCVGNTDTTTKTHSLELNDHVSYVLGYLVGHGCLKENRISVHFSNRDKLAKDKVIELLDDLSTHINFKYTCKEAEGYFSQIDCYSRHLFEFWKGLGFVEDSRDKRVPRVVMRTLNFRLWRCFIAGLWQAIGAVNIYEVRKHTVGKKWVVRKVSLISSSPSLLKQILVMLDVLGYTSRIRGKGRGGERSLELSPESAVRFLSDFSEFKGVFDLTEVQESLLCKSLCYNADMTISVVGVKKIEDLVTYGCVVDGGLHYSSGVVTHNCKHGLIFTGYETPEDFDDSLAEFKQILEIRRDMGANTSVRVTITPLCYYPHTALQRLERRTSLMNLRGERTLRPYLMGFRDLGIRTKINGRSRSTFMEQFLLDFGRFGTKYLCALSSEEPPYYGSVPKSVEEHLLSMFDRDGVNPEAFMREKPDEHFLWHNTVKTVNQKYLNRWAKGLKEKTLKGSGDGVLSLRQCSVSPANLPKGSEGPYVATCHGCGNCKSADEINATLTRKIESEKTAKDFHIALSRARSNWMTVVGVDLKSEVFFMSSTTLSHRVSALMLQSNPDEFEPLFYQVGKTNLNWVTNNYQRDWIYGRIMFPIYWSDRITFNSEEIIKFINYRLDSAEVISISDLKLSEKPVKLKDKIIYRMIVPGMTKSKIQSGWMTFNGRVQVASKSVSRDIELEWKDVKGIEAPVCKDVSKGALVFLVLPVNVNPYLFISSITGATFKDLTRTADVKALYTVRDGSGVCLKCDSPKAEDVLGIVPFVLCTNCIGLIMASKSEI